MVFPHFDLAGLVHAALPAWHVCGTRPKLGRLLASVSNAAVDLTAQSTSLIGEAHLQLHTSGLTSFASVAAEDQVHPQNDELQALDGGTVRIDLLNNNNSQYYGDLVLGSGGAGGAGKQRFTAIFDTGSAITWVPGAKCQSETCNEHHRFSGADSETFQEEKGDSTIHYGTGEVKFEKGMDTLSFCDSGDNAGCHGNAQHQVEVPNHPFGTSTEQTTYPFRILPFDGILGLAPSTNSGSVLHQMKAAKALDRNVMGVYLSQDTHRSGSIDFGGIESQHIAPGHEVSWHPIMEPGEWKLGMKDILVNGKPLHLCDARPGGVCPAVVDTGSSLITGPRSEIGKLLAEVHTKEDCSNLREMPTISLQFQDTNGDIKSYPLTPEEYTLKAMEEVPGTGHDIKDAEFVVLGREAGVPDLPDIVARCDPGIGVMDVPGKKWVIGDSFLRRYYSIYDDDKSLVGFVRSIHPDEAPPSLPALTSAPRTAEAACISPSCAAVLTTDLRNGGCVSSDSRRANWAGFL